ncbi:hypothetical protein AKJ59_00760 [candidate division MSBL1 archaeon SCGC-AAA385M02]|uniref:Uncharacterized protein n=1 Tax=candidate division MSBL1 archaeon SCGC-AAA385M02 TaxID=1698287 RepID=A0A133VQ47_9EURY|nr:hypothetical protein AKJ59_00760 [candidate division MSBL1 archaeon SCGC-AAA385M02]
MRYLYAILLMFTAYLPLQADNTGYFSISLRDGYHDTEKIEYELKTGVKTAYFKTGLKMEREFDNFYRGCYLITEKTDFESVDEVVDKLVNQIYLDLKIDEARQLNSLSINKDLVSIPNDDYNFLRGRLVNRWNHWDYTGPLLGMILDLSKEEITTTIEYDTNFYDSHIFKSEFAKKIKLDKWYIEPKYEIYRSENLEYWQLKSEFGIMF